MDKLINDISLLKKYKNKFLYYNTLALLPIIGKYFDKKKFYYNVKYSDQKNIIENIYLDKHSKNRFLQL